MYYRVSPQLQNTGTRFSSGSGVALAMREKDSCSFKGSECNSAPFVSPVLAV